ncbi:MAG TPA: COX15/CtaA family protein [Xanthobacteraceae bacterium]|nr:COX15/CtaA family protein [Xanthobacteraceae bacterium]
MEKTCETGSGRAVRVWLWAVAALVFAMVVVGGATRLTESGLSITEWHPVTGVLPPLSAAAWQELFDKYKAIPQYQALNAGMSLGAFKAIFWWEWTHRLLGRVIGAVFFLPFLWFLLRGEITRQLRPRLWLIFGLGAFQGAVGWWMVASGLTERIEVSPYRLAFHLTLAATIFVALVWTAQEQVPRSAEPSPPRLRSSAVLLLALVLGQIYLGALVAGLRAGRIDNTWPLMEGRFVPPSAQLFFNEPWWRNFFENPLTVQFDHRMLAYCIAALALLHAIDAARSGARTARRGALVLAGAVLLQASLGIFTLLEQAPLALALMHQAMAMIVLTAAAVHAQAVPAAQTCEAIRPDTGAAAELSTAAPS